jgi:hypothetical protein
LHLPVAVQQKGSRMACKCEGGSDQCIRSRNRECLVGGRLRRALVSAERRALDLCHQCGKEAVPGRRRCAVCLEKSSASTANYRAKWLARGLCTCGARNPVIPGRPRCLSCAFKRHEANAKLKKMTNEVDFEKFCKLVLLPCMYCNEPVAGGIDRVKNEYGYTILNSVPCCAACNFLKGDIPAPDFYRCCARVIAHSATYEQFKPRWHALTRPEGGPSFQFSSFTATPVVDQPSLSNSIH